MIRSALGTEAQLLDSLVLGAYDDAGRTAAVIHELRSADASWDPDLVLLDEGEDGLPVACLVLRPRQIVLRGQAVPVAVVAALAVSPGTRGQGIARRLVEEGARRAREKGGLALLGLGPTGLGSALDFHPAFGHCQVRLATDQDRWPDLPAVRWRALDAADLEALCELHHRTAGQTDGVEIRSPSATDWASGDPHTHSVVLDGRAGPEAYVRFTVQDQLVAADPVVGSPAAALHLVSFLLQVAGEHTKQHAEIRVALDHPFSRFLMERGAAAETHGLMGATAMRVLDRDALAEMLAPGRGGQALAGVDVTAAELPGLMTGHRIPSATAFADSPEAHDLRAAFPPGHPWWALSPAFDSVWL